MKRFVIAVACGVLAIVGITRAQEPPKPGPEHKKIEFFAGKWNVTGTAKASPMGPAGPFTSTDVCEMFEGGFALVCRTEGKGPMGPSKSLSIMSYDTGKNAYVYHAVETNMPAFTAWGNTTDGTWNWTSESKMGANTMKSKVTITQTGPNGYDFIFEMSMDDGPFQQIVEAKATRSAT
jgi:Protein of unknown function (DUF1579)